MMRSRVEARFAAFADELGWDWEYEPMDLPGYIPDFALHFRGSSTGILYGALWCVGDLLEKSEATFTWDKAVLHRCLACARVTYVGASGSWHCRACLAGPGNGHLDEFDPQDAFAIAQNRVQWRPSP